MVRLPGVIGYVGTAPGRQGVNIANFALDRERIQERFRDRIRDGAEPVQALSVAQADEPAEPHVLEVLTRIPNLLQARLARLG